jgi:hypothetical protein
LIVPFSTQVSARISLNRAHFQANMSKKAIADQEIKIKDSLFEFVKTHTTNADLTLIDDIVLSYVVAILEDVSSDPVFSVEGKPRIERGRTRFLAVVDFCEMMSAYFPEFESINHATVSQWIFELAAKLRVDEPEEKSVIEISLPEIVPKTKPRQLDNRDSFDLPKRVHRLSEMSDGGSTDSSCCDFLDEIDVLQEMFPHVCSIEVSLHFFSNSNPTFSSRNSNSRDTGVNCQCCQNFVDKDVACCVTILQTRARKSLLENYQGTHALVSTFDRC